MMKILITMLLIFNAALAREYSYVSDPFGYQAVQTCPSTYLDISGDAQILTLVPSAADTAKDEGGVVYTLMEPFKFYKGMENSIVVSSNGYLSFAESLVEEDGGDFSNDCLFPSVPSNQPDSLKRILPFHGDLVGTASGEIRTAYYAQCPRVGVNNSSCTVIEWHNWRRSNDVQVFSFQVLLYHASAELVIQYGSNVANSEEASIGFQDAKIFSGQILSCNHYKELSNKSFCFQNPEIFSNGFEQSE